MRLFKIVKYIGYGHLGFQIDFGSLKNCPEAAKGLYIKRLMVMCFDLRGCSIFEYSIWVNCNGPGARNHLRSYKVLEHG